MFNNWKSFINWEKSTKDTIDVKKTYIDMADDFMSGVLLSQIVYWYLPNKEGKSKLKVKKENHYWIAKKVEDWYEEIRFSRRNYDTAIKKLVEKDIVIKKRFKFDGTPTSHIRLNIPVFLLKLNEVLSSYEGNLDQEYDDFDTYLQEEISSEPLINIDSYESHISNRTNRTNGNEQNEQMEIANRTNGNPRNVHMKTGDSFNSLTENTTKNTTEITTEITCSSSSNRVIESNRNLTDKRIEEEEEIINLINENFCYEVLGDFLHEKNIGKETIMKTLIECYKKGLEIFTMEDITKQYNHMMDKQRYGERIFNFPTYFANGLNDLAEQTKSSRVYQQEKLRDYEIAMKQREDRVSKIPYYNWLEE
ncbi:hypothetical protein HUN92_13500 [Bacillus firmus]|uniref:hypothetical protein n=1 Tax=Cytobacillus firmus TaxID=1399 RepID=UPI0015800E8B|nr:hypothetical protein [Cytobacillus firmus]NUH84735.1 hypothetical protein [Cytobacillus firmus]